MPEKVPEKIAVSMLYPPDLKYYPFRAFTPSLPQGEMEYLATT
jgi:hypothetical protein